MRRRNQRLNSNRLESAAKTMSTFAEVIVEFLPTSQGGRSSLARVGNKTRRGYMPHFVVAEGDATYLGVEFIDEPHGSIAPGDCAAATVRFLYEPAVCYERLVESASFEIREGGRTVGSGRIVRRFCGNPAQP